MTLTPQNLEFVRLIFAALQLMRLDLLLHEHDEETGLGRTTVALDSEELPPETLALALSLLDLKQLVGVVHVASSLDVVPSQTLKRSESLVVLALLHVPILVLAFQDTSC